MKLLVTLIAGLLLAQEKPQPKMTELSDSEKLEFARLQTELFYRQRESAQAAEALSRAQAQKQATDRDVRDVLQRYLPMLTKLRGAHHAGDNCEPSITEQKWICQERKK